MASPFYPAFKLTVYAPRSVDPTESTVLTPTAGAAHSDPFVVSTLQGLAGAQPYLDFPNGRTGTIDPLNKKTTVGTQTFRVLDPRVTAGGSNLVRWATAFLGDGKGGNLLLGRKVVALQSLDNGATWDATPYWTGRITGTGLDGALWLALTTRDPSKDLDVDVFVSGPHSSVASYAHLAQVAPLGLLQDYGGFPKTQLLKGTVSGPGSGTRPSFRINVDRTYGADLTRTLITQALYRASQMGHLGRSAKTGWRGPKLYLRTTELVGAFTEYDFDSLSLVTTTSVEFIDGRQVNKTGAAALPADGTVVYFYISDPTAEPSEDVPLYINDVDPVDYVTDLCAGKFGHLDDTGEPLRAVPVNAAALAVLDTGRYIPWRRRVTKKSKLNAEIEAVCRAYHWAYYLNGAGEVVFVDLRRTATTAPVATLDDADLVAPDQPLKWNQTSDDAVTAVLGTYHPERQVTPGELPKPFEGLPPGSIYLYADAPSIPAGRIAEDKELSVLIPIVGPRAGDVKPNTFEMDAEGIRVSVSSNGSSSEKLNGVDRIAAIQGHFESIAAEITGPYGLGPSVIDLNCRRASADVALVTQGKFVVLDMTKLPDPATNQRGGQRLVFCLSRTDDGLTTRLRMLDCGANSVALVPTVGVLAVLAGTNPGVDVPITLNAAGEPVRVAYAVTETSVAVRPAENDQRWTTGQLVTATGSTQLTNIAKGKRVWVRARTEPSAGAGFKLPSAWAFPAAGSIDISAITAPSAFAVTGATVDATVARWTSGDATLDVEVLMVTGAAPGAWADTDVIATLPAGSVEFSLRELITTGTQYTVGVRHRDKTAGVSTVASATFVAPAAVVLNAPRNPDGFSSSALRFADKIQPQRYGLAVIATEHPCLVEYAVAVETGVGTGVYGAFATVGQVESVSGDWTKWIGLAPNDRKRRQIKARHVRDGATSSAYTTPVVVTPGTFDPLAEYPVAGPTVNATLASRTRAIENITLEGAIGANDGGPLQWRYKVGTGAWSGLSATALPQTITINRADGFATPVLFEVVQGDSQSRSCAYSVPARELPSHRVAVEDDARVGTGGVPTPLGRIRPDVIYDSSGTTPLVDTITRRAQTGLLGPAGTQFDQIETGGNRGFGGFTNTTGGLVGTAADSRSALLNNHFRYGTDSTNGVVDGTGSPLTGGQRGFLTIDGSNRVKRGNGFDDGNYAATATNSTGYGLHGSVVDSRSALLNNHFRYGTDSTNGVVDGTGSPLTGGQRGFLALNGSNKLQTGVTSAATGADGYSGIESRRGAAKQTGFAAQGIINEDSVRAGNGGVPVARSRIATDPIYDSTGSTPLIDPLAREVKSGLAIGSGVRGAADVAFGATVKYTPSRHNEDATGKNTDTPTFGIDFEQVPNIRAIPMVWRIPGASSTVDRKVECRPINVTVSGCQIRAVISTGSSSTSQSENWSATLNGSTASTQSISSPGAAAYCNLTNANTTLTRYKVYYDVNTTILDVGVIMRVRVYKNNGTGSTSWTQVASANYDAGLSLSNEVLQFDAAMDANWDLQIVVTYSTTPFTNGTVTVKHTDYEKITAGSETAITGDADAAVLIQATEVS